MNSDRSLPEMLTLKCHFVGPIPLGWHTKEAQRPTRPGSRRNFWANRAAQNLQGGRSRLGAGDHAMTFSILSVARDTLIGFSFGLFLILGAGVVTQVYAGSPPAASLAAP